MAAGMRIVKCRSIAPILLGLVGITCTVPDAVFIEDTVIFLPFGKTPDKPMGEALQDAGEFSSSPEPALETGH